MQGVEEQADVGVSNNLGLNRFMFLSTDPISDVES